MSCRPTSHEIRALAYFQVAECLRARRQVGDVLVALAAPTTAPVLAETVTTLLFNGWLTDMNNEQYALTHSGQAQLNTAISRVKRA